MRRKTKQLNFEALRSSLKVRHNSSRLKLHRNNPKASQFWQKHGLDPAKIRHQAKKLLASTALAGSMLLSAQTGLPATALNGSKQVVSHVAPGEIRRLLRSKISTLLPFSVGGQLDEFAEKQISTALKNAYGINASAQLEGNRLNHSYGRMGAEQHLPRFPQDAAENHGQLIEKGITPGRGAWGYFANGKDELTPELEQTEKYYVAVQTLYLPTWNTDTARLRDWYKYRHVVVINPANGKTIVAAIADAGPANWTGKQFGGSPEVMEYLGIDYGQQNHPVVLLFLNDPQNKIPLGPLEYNINNDE